MDRFQRLSDLVSSALLNKHPSSGHAETEPRLLAPRAALKNWGSFRIYYRSPDSSEHRRHHPIGKDPLERHVLPFLRDRPVLTILMVPFKRKMFAGIGRL